MTCPRLWAVEAARDGRLVGVEKETAERHLATCPSCAAEKKRLDALGLALRSLPSAPPDPLTVRREKQRLLAAADAKLVAPSGRWRALIFGAAVVAPLLVAALFVVARKPSSPPNPSAVVAPGENARWSRTTDGHQESITLDEGSLSLHVHRAAPEDRVIVFVPDGEIEDRGTVFSVDVASGHTRRVKVEEGAVVFRRPGRASILLDRGQTWEGNELALAPHDAVLTKTDLMPAPSKTTEAFRAAESPAPITVSPPPARSPIPAPVRGPRPKVSSSAPHAAASSEFRAGFLAIEEGNNGDATKHLSSEIDAAKDGARAEDAAYLRIVALVRANARDKARVLAREYLQQFPRGFRRAEVEAIAR